MNLFCQRITLHKALNIALAIAICAVAATAHHLDLSGEATERIDAARDLQDAQRQARQRARFERAAQSLCGQHFGWVLISDTEIQCGTQQGIKTRSAKVSL